MSPRANHTAAAALLYWLMVMCGLAGLSVVRADSPREFVPLWIGSVVGVALGQGLAWLRLRVWLIAVMSICVLASSPIVLAIVYATFGSFGSGLDTCLLALLPAAVCGYLSLSERAGLVAFWYPAMLWMLVILDRPGGSAFDARAAVPLVAGLGGLFVVFLRSRETRRAAIWGAFSTDRLAEPLSRTVLRTSPLRAASHHLWTGFVGASALVLAVWVAPHLWHKEAAKGPSPAAMRAAEATYTTGAEDLSGDRCCNADDLDDERRERVKEYFPLKHGRDVEVPRSVRSPCTHCQSGKHRRIASGGAKGDPGTYATSGYGKAGTSTGSGTWSGDTTPSAPGYGAGYGGGGTANDGYGGYAANTGYAPAPPPPDPLPEVAPLPPTPPLPPAPPHATHGAAPAKLGATPTASTRPPPSNVDAVGAQPVYVAANAPPPPQPAVVLTPRPAPPPAGVPWRSALALTFAGMALHLALRAARRQLTLRHLARPFWRETLDQRISNHWQRMLIGLRDAGIHPKADEQPQALAKRVGLDGMSTCATILERVRHGVQVDATDLDAMDAAASNVYRAAREQAGAVACAAALIRSPL